MATPRQRSDLAKLAADLTTTLDTLPRRYWATRSQRDAWDVVIAHIRNWVAWEEGDSNES